MKPSKSLIGIAGAHFVAAELSQLGYISTLTSRNTEGIDVLVSKPDGSKLVSIQVKTSGPGLRKSYCRSWIMQEKHEGTFSNNLFYVFVDLKPNNEKPDFYIVPSIDVATYIKESHEKWLKEPSKRTGKKHNDNSMRVFEIDNDQVAAKYQNSWDNLGIK